MWATCERLWTSLRMWYVPSYKWKLPFQFNRLRAHHQLIVTWFWGITCVCVSFCNTLKTPYIEPCLTKGGFFQRLIYSFFAKINYNNKDWTHTHYWLLWIWDMLDFSCPPRFFIIVFRTIHVIMQKVYEMSYVLFSSACDPFHVPRTFSWGFLL